MSHDLQRQLDTATAFFLAGERCSLTMRFGAYQLHSVSAPTIVNYAFAVELALKLIHSLAHGTAARGHKLQDLYNMLPDESRRHLPYLIENVAEISQYFENWRYSFEHEFLCGEYTHPRRAFIECYGEIKRLQPELASVYESNWGNFEPEWIQTWPSHDPRWELRLIDP